MQAFGALKVVLEVTTLLVSVKIWRF